MTFLYTHFRICFLAFLLHNNGYCVEIRLVGSGVSYKGRVEVLYNRQWGTICDDDWGTKNAMVVCRQLGYPPAGAVARQEAYYGHGRGQIWMDNVECSGSETDIALCEHDGWGTHNCKHSKDASVDCKLPRIRLVGGVTNYQGRVEIQDGQWWGTVCDDKWGDSDAAVVCRQLGYESRGAKAKGEAFFGKGSGNILLDYVACEGTEDRLVDCRSSAWKEHDCEHNEDAGVICDDINECANPMIYCVHGRCRNSVGNYNCECLRGWSGRRCNTDIDECLNRPCINGECSNTDGGFSCVCAKGWTGELCDKGIDECVNDPCINGECTNTDGGFSCVCAKGWTGELCDKDNNIVIGIGIGVTVLVSIIICVSVVCWWRKKKMGRVSTSNEYTSSQMECTTITDPSDQPERRNDTTTLSGSVHMPVQRVVSTPYFNTTWLKKGTKCTTSRRNLVYENVDV